MSVGGGVCACECECVCRCRSGCGGLVAGVDHPPVILPRTSAGSQGFKVSDHCSSQCTRDFCQQPLSYISKKNKPTAVTPYQHRPPPGYLPQFPASNSSLCWDPACVTRSRHTPRRSIRQLTKCRLSPASPRRKLSSARHVRLFL